MGLGCASQRRSADGDSDDVLQFELWYNRADQVLLTELFTLR